MEHQDRPGRRYESRSYDNWVTRALGIDRLFERIDDRFDTIERMISEMNTNKAALESAKAELVKADAVVDRIQPDV